MGQYDLGLKYAKYALRIALPPTQLYRLSMLRGQAYTGLKQHTKAMRDLLDALGHKPQDPAVLQALIELKKSLHPDPLKAHNAFTNLRTAVENYRLENSRGRDQMTAGKVVIKDMACVLRNSCYPLS